jgi:hypothetical protein
MRLTKCHAQLWRQTECSVKVPARLSDYNFRSFQARRFSIIVQETRNSMPKVCSLPSLSRFTAEFVFWSIGLAGLAAIGCNQEKPQELNPPPAGPPSYNADVKPNVVPTQPLGVTPAPLAPTTADAANPATGPDIAKAPVGSGPVTTQPTPPTSRAESEIPIDGPARGPKPGVTELPTTVPSSEPAASPAVPATNPAATEPAESRPSAGRSFTGTLHGGVVAAGSETTGWALNVDGGTGALDIDVTAISGQVKALDGRHVTITGQLKEKNWVERGKTELLIADTIVVAPIPEMNK